MNFPTKAISFDDAVKNFPVTRREGGGKISKSGPLDRWAGLDHTSVLMEVQLHPRFVDLLHATVDNRLIYISTRFA